MKPMKSLLHVVTRPLDAMARGIVEATRVDPGLRVEVVDLNAGEPDYGALVGRIFESDAIATW